MLTCSTDTDTFSQQSMLQAYVRSISSEPLLTDDEQATLGARIAAGDERARRVLVERNLRLVISIVKRYQGQGLELLDLIQEGNIGLMAAADRFDPCGGANFATYAKYRIRRDVNLAIAHTGRTIRVPANIHDEMVRITRCAKQLADTLGREALPSEIATMTGLDEATILRRIGIVEDALPLDFTATSGSAPSNVIASNDASALPHETMHHAQVAQHVEQALACLSDREQLAICMSHGLRGHDEHKLAEIGVALGISAQMTGRVVKQALAKLLDAHPGLIELL